MKWMNAAWKAVNNVLDEGEGEAGPLFSDEELAFQVNAETVGFIGELSRHPMTWMEFPLDALAEQDGLHEDSDASWGAEWASDDQDEPEDQLEDACEENVKRLAIPWILNEPQKVHCSLIIKRCPELARLRYRLVPRHMEDDVFWKIYFTLARQHVRLQGHGGALFAGAAEEPRRHQTRPQPPPAWQLEAAPRRSKSASRCIKQAGVPQQHRQRIWLLLVDTQAEPHKYREEQERVFGPHGVPELMLRCPQFQSNVAPEQVVLQRALTVLCVGEYGGQDFHATQLVSLGQQLSSVMDEPQMYACLRVMAARSVSATLLQGSSEGGHVWASRRHAAFGCHLFELLIREELPDVWGRMNHLGIRAQKFCLNWFQTLFTQVLVTEEDRRVLTDRFLLQGARALYKAALAVMFVNKGTLTSCETVKEFMTSVRVLAKKHQASIISSMALFQVGRRKLLDLLEDSESPLVEEAHLVVPAGAQEVGAPMFSRVRLDEASECAQPVVWEFVWQLLPWRHRQTRPPRRCYSTTAHGCSLRTMYARAAAQEPPFVLFCRTGKGALLGAFISDAIKPGHDKCSGSGEMFVFVGHSHAYHWDEVKSSDRLFMVARAQDLSIGGGALVLDEYLERGYSAESGTFCSPALCDPSNFSVLCVELWKI